MRETPHRDWAPEFLAERIFDINAENAALSRVTVFLDNIADLDRRVQARLLRLIEDPRVHLLAREKGSAAGNRIIAATNRTLATEVAVGHFRADLFDRINVIALRIPPLREHAEDILPLADYFLHRAIPKDNRCGLRISTDAASAISRYLWPGNARTP
jgi:anaerobic nitric oxide reductase transcription regulator